MLRKGNHKKDLVVFMVVSEHGAKTSIKYGHLGGTTLSSHWIGCFSNSGYDQELTIP
jgi:hypothetical protein